MQLHEVCTLQMEYTKMKRKNKLINKYDVLLFRNYCKVYAQFFFFEVFF